MPVDLYVQYSPKENMISVVMGCVPCPTGNNVQPTSINAPHPPRDPGRVGG